MLGTPGPPTLCGSATPPWPPAWGQRQCPACSGDRTETGSGNSPRTGHDWPGQGMKVAHKIGLDKAFQVALRPAIIL